MKLTWYPDYCSGGQCRIEVTQGQTDLAGAGFERLCAHHQSLLDGGLTPGQVFRALRNSGMAKENARWALKQDFMQNRTLDDDYVSETNPTGEIDKEWPGIPFRVAANGDIIIEPARVKIPPNARQRLSKLVDDESKKIEQVPGISRVILE